MSNENDELVYVGNYYGIAYSIRIDNIKTAENYIAGFTTMLKREIEEEAAKRKKERR